MFGIGLPELIVIVVLALLIIVPKDLPQMAREFGKTVRNLRRTAEDFKEEIRKEVDRVEPEEPSEPERRIAPMDELRKTEDR